MVNAAVGLIGATVPNYEIFIIPMNSSAKEENLQSMTGSEISSYLNQSMRKSRRILPGNTLYFNTLRPRVVGYKGPINKEAGTSLMCMESPTYYSTHATSLTVGGSKQIDVTHYGQTVLIRRVDGTTLHDHSGPTDLQHMGFRYLIPLMMTSDVFPGWKTMCISACGRYNNNPNGCPSVKIRAKRATRPPGREGTRR